MNPQAHDRIPEPFAAVKSLNTSEDPARIADTADSLDPRSLSAKETRTMIPTDIVTQKTGLSRRKLIRMRILGLLPRPTRIPTAGLRGSAYAYPATIFTRLRVIAFLQGHGFTLTQIAHSARGTPFDCPESRQSKDPYHA